MVNNDAYLDMLIPDNGFMLDYYNYAEPMTEAPSIWHSFMALSLIATVVGRKRWLHSGGWMYYPNLWTIFIAPSSRMKKSTVLNIGKDLLYQSSLDTHLFPNDFSREGMLSQLVKNAQGLFVWQEMGGVLKTFDLNYMAGTKEMLTDLFDGKPYKRLLRKEEIKIEEPCINIAAASTMEWLNQSLKDNDISGGFLPRFIFVSAEKPSKILPFPPPPTEEETNSIIFSLKQISQINSGAMYLSAPAERLYSDWYHKSHSEAYDGTDPEMMAPFFSRLEVYVLKYAMLYQINESHNELLISAESMERSLKVIEYLKDNIRTLYSTTLLESKEDRLTSRILRIIKQSRYSHGISRSDLRNNAKPEDSRAFDMSINRLLLEKKIIVVPDGKTTRYATIPD